MSYKRTEELRREMLEMWRPVNFLKRMAWMAGWSIIIGTVLYASQVMYVYNAGSGSIQ